MNKWLWLAFPLTIALTAVVTWLASLYVFERPVFGDSVQQRRLSSAVLGEPRDYLVHLPESYVRSTGKRYPVSTCSTARPRTCTRRTPRR
jgi:hypothetical protein